MKLYYSPDDRVMITRVPERAAGWVRVGELATVLELVSIPGNGQVPDGLMKVRMDSGWDFWWAEDDLCLIDPDTTRPMPRTPYTVELKAHAMSMQLKHLVHEPRGYDPYNSATTRPGARTDVWRTERVTIVRKNTHG